MPILEYDLQEWKDAEFDMLLSFKVLDLPSCRAKQFWNLSSVLLISRFEDMWHVKLRGKASVFCCCLRLQTGSCEISQVLRCWLAAAAVSLWSKHLVERWTWNSTRKQMNQTRNHPTEQRLPTSNQCTDSLNESLPQTGLHYSLSC